VPPPLRRRVAVVVLDACGAGELPDSADYGDAGADTLVHVAREAGGLRLPNLERLGLGNVLALDGVPPSARPALHGRLHPLGPGKDSTAGHWELMGHVAPAPLPVYLDGPPADLLELLRDATGHALVSAGRRDGLAAIRDFGEQSLRTGALVVYTSQDSVVQLAAHTAAVPEAELHAACLAARTALGSGPCAVGRVIARPFAGEPGSFERTDGRRDYALEPGPTYLDALQAAGVPVHAVGKAGELFGGRGIDREHRGPRSAIAIAAVSELLAELERGLIFANLVDTDQIHGHRHDVAGFARALEEVDTAAGAWLGLLRDGDLLVLTADHGCDPLAAHTDHTREHVPLLAIFAGAHGPGVRRDGPMADVGASALACLAGGDEPELPGTPWPEAAP
jgi:phosphopentomutase